VPRGKFEARVTEGRFQHQRVALEQLGVLRGQPFVEREIAGVDDALAVFAGDANLRAAQHVPAGKSSTHSLPS